MGVLFGVGDFGLEDLLIAAQTAEQTAITAKNQAIAAAQSIGEGKPQGPYNATTNSPSLGASSAAYPEAAFFDVTVGGTLNFAGFNFASGQVVKIGDRLKKIGTQWYLSPAISQFIDPKESTNLIASSNLTPDKYEIRPSNSSASVLTNPIVVRQVGNPGITFLKPYRGFNYAIQLVLASTERVNYFSQRIELGKYTLAAGDKVMGGVFLEIPAGASLTINAGVRQSTSNSGINGAYELLSVGGDWKYLRFISPITVQNPSDGLIDFYVYITNTGSSSVTVNFAAPALVKTQAVLAPLIYNGVEAFEIPNVSNFTAREEVNATFYNVVKDALFAGQTLGATTVAAPWSINTGGTGTFAAPIEIVNKVSPVGNRAIKIAHSKRSSDNFITDRQVIQKISIPMHLQGVTKMSFGYWAARETTDVNFEQSLFTFYSDASGSTVIGSNVGVNPVFTETAVGDWTFVRFENITVPANALVVQVNIRSKYLTSSAVDTVRNMWIGGVMIAFGNSKALAVPFNVYDQALAAAKEYYDSQITADTARATAAATAAILADKQANPVDPTLSIASIQNNPVKDQNFKAQAVGATSLVTPWIATAAGGTNFQAPYEVVEKSMPANYRALKISLSKRSSDNYTSDFQLNQKLQVPTEGLGADKMSFGLWIQRDSLDVAMNGSFLTFYSNVEATTVISTLTTNAPGFDATVVGSPVFAKYDNIAVPAGTKAMELRIRMRYGGSALDTVVVGYITTPVVYFGSAKGYSLPFNIDEKAKQIATDVVQQALAGGGGSSANIRTDKLSYGSRMRRTLAKLLSMSIDGQGAAQPKFDNQVRICHFGDSIVAQQWSSGPLITGVTGTTDGRDFVGLEKKYPYANFHVTNCGVGGQQAKHFKKHLWGQVIPYDPDLIIISTWLNDQMSTWTNNTSQFQSSLEEIIKYLRKHTTADIAICSCSLYTNTYEKVAGSPGYKNELALAQKYNCEFIDIARFMRDFGAAQTVPFYSTDADIQEWATRGYYTSGDVHPLNNGQQVLAKAVAEHFPPVNDLFTSFDWNALGLNWATRQPVTQAEAVFEYLDSAIKLSDETKFVTTATSENNERDSLEVLASAATTADGEYVEFEFEGNGIDLVYGQASDGANATITIDGAAPSTQSFCSIWYPDADTANTYTASSKREAMIRYTPGKWKVPEVLTITMTGTAGQVSQTYDLTGSVSGSILTGQSTANPVKAALADGSFIWIRPENWEGRTTNVYSGDKFYIRIYNAQCLPLESMRTWSDSNGADRRFPLISAPANLDSEYTIRFLYTSATAFRVDIVRRRDMTGETDTLNVVTALGTGTITDNGWSGGGLSISQAELTRLSGIAISGRRYYYWVHRKFSDTINFSGATAYKKVRLATLLENKKHILRITKTGTGKMYLDSFRPFRPVE
ncbi:SGNH/GDSL hydrolase family protein [Siphonobacter curvatus]|uniref:SGNH hydrolase-type esterase domain-containing protein n=1 Tax=Siphonobacter curvatus TaxID=2094562 RepID=A0A2S7IR53_9BACT|nr:SGNH/GDSL hydrolase family protein [Siphonobacter curvatus]PQA60201.1 hypothetical protein C5O19_11445 [Siphonobacter curvatus]